MFQGNTDKIFNELPIAFYTADDILILGYDSNGVANDKNYAESCRYVEI